MSSSATLTVLCPNARRQTVRAVANTKILELIEEVCKKQGLDPAQYDLVFQKKHLDVTVTYRLSGVPNNAQLELVKLENGPRRISPVSVCLQLDDGTRLPPRQFQPDTTSVFGLLEAYATDEKSLESSHAEQLRRVVDTTQMGEQQPVVTYLSDQVVGHYQMRNTSLLELGLASGRFVVRLSEKHVGVDEMERANVEFKAKLEKKSKLDEIYARKQNEASQEQVETRVKNETASIRPTPQVVQQQVFEDRSERQEPKRVKIEQTNLVETSNRRQEIVPEEFHRVNEFENFKFPEETRGQDLVGSHNELEAIERESREACEREAVRFSLAESKSEASGGGSGRDVADDEDFYVVTVDDLRSRMTDLQRVQNDDAPLMTRQMRELARDKRAMKYSKVAVRVSFKNGTILQGLFRPKEPISNLYKFVRSCLEVENDSFKLFVTPPKKILTDMKQTLFDAGLCPASIVYFKSSSNETENGVATKLRDDIRSVSIDEANEIVEEYVHKAMRHVDHEGFKWLEKESNLVQNILKNSSIRDQGGAGGSSSHDYDGAHSSSTRSSNQQQQDPSRRRMEKFLGFKK